jgi:predicted RNase H-like nuclease (RuvC/YqgF family)|tara:strand:+ start:467 stop:1012 length:546 start_codon:yes stop_codon:yes gene_type:complete
MEFHNPTDVQSVPTVDALHVVNKKHKEEVESLKKEMQNLRDRNTNQMKQLNEWSVDTDYIEQDELKDDFIALINKLKEVFKTVKDDVLLVAEAEYSDNNNYMNAKVIDELVDMYKDLMEKLMNYEFMYKWSVSGTVDFSISEIEAKNAEDAETQARDMCYEGFYNGDCEVDDVNADNIEQQ